MDGNKWLKLNSGAAQAKLRAKLAADVAARDAKFKKRMRLQQRHQEVFDQLDEDQFEAFYSEAALDRRCELRHAPEVLTALRLWSRALEAHERAVTGTAPVVVHEAMYITCLTKVALAMTREPTKAELLTSVQGDWKRDSRTARLASGQPTISFERFKVRGRPATAPRPPRTACFLLSACLPAWPLCVDSTRSSR